MLWVDMGCGMNCIGERGGGHIRPRCPSPYSQDKVVNWVKDSCVCVWGGGVSVK